MDRNTSAEISQLGVKRTLSDSDAESLPPIHRDAVVTIAVDMRISVDRVLKLYCIVLERLSKEARIRDYLPILVTKKVRNLMRKRLKTRDKRDVTESREQASRN